MAELSNRASRILKDAASGAGLAFAVLVAAIFFCAALTPSLMPRSPITQGIISGGSAAIGFEIGRLILWLWRYLEIREVPRDWYRPLALILFGLAAAVFLYALWSAAGWQNATRSAVGLDPLTTAEPLTIVLVAIVAFIIIWGIIWVVKVVLRAVDRLLMKILPRRVALLLGFVVVAWLAWGFTSGVLVDALLRFGDGIYSASFDTFDADVVQPQSPMKTGSEASLVKWEGMGRWGRAFVVEGPTQEEIAEFTGGPAMEPIRVYVGLRSADDARSRAELALQELIRVGGFDRSVLMLVIPTGSGWMDPGAQDTLDFVLGGDVATVVAQYSWLGSELAVLAGTEIGVEQARELFDVIYSYWTKLPKEARPKFYVHGLSLGAFNLQAGLQLLDVLSDPINGAMWAGSPFFAPVWARTRDGRQPDSPVWLPRYGNGSLVRAMNQDGFAGANFAPWGPTRLVFLTYGGDPIALFSFRSATRKPEWASDPHAPDIPPSLRWFPIVTMLQVALDAAFALNVPGFGHYYYAPDYIDAWVELFEPDGWSEEKSDRLKAIFAERPLPL